MSPRRWTLASVVGAALLAAAPVRADKTVTTLADAVTTPGVTAAIHNEGAEVGSEILFFQFEQTGNGGARIEFSSDNGATFRPIHVFRGASDLFWLPACGGCRVRANVFSASPGNTVTVRAMASGGVTLTVVP